MRFGIVSAGLGILLAMPLFLRAEGVAEAEGVGSTSGVPAVHVQRVWIVRGGTPVIVVRGGIPPFPNLVVFGYTMRWEEVTERPISVGGGRSGFDAARYGGSKRTATRRSKGF